jgi:hypothetical protein
MAVYAYKSVITWPDGHARAGTGNSDFEWAGRNYMIANVTNPDQLVNGDAVPHSITVDGVEVAVHTASLDLGPVVVTRLWETEQKAQDFVNFVTNLCAEHNVSLISAVVEPNT